MALLDERLLAYPTRNGCHCNGCHWRFASAMSESRSLATHALSRIVPDQRLSYIWKNEEPFALAKRAHGVG